MTVPLLIDTDMGIDDAVAIGLAMATDALDLRALVSVGGNVSLGQATRNIGRLLSHLGTNEWPLIGEGLDQADAALERAHHVFAEDGLGGLESPAKEKALPPSKGFIEVYDEATAAAKGELAICAIGPLTNLAAIWDQRPDILKRASRIIVMGGAVWVPGNVTPHAEFNFYRDPAAAAAVLSSGLPITLISLDVTRQVAMDESHAAHLARSGSSAGQVLGRMIRWPLENHKAEGDGQFLVHDALTIGFILWPEFFTSAKLGIDVTQDGPQAGRTKPVMLRDKSKQIRVAMSIDDGEFLERMIELLCRETFVV